MYCIWGSHEIERFACKQSALLPRYNSFFLGTHTLGVDALAQSDWNKLNNWFRLIPKILNVIKSQKAVATLIAQESKWPFQ